MSGKAVLVCLFGVLAISAVRAQFNTGCSCGLSSGNILSSGSCGSSYGNVEMLGNAGFGYGSVGLNSLGNGVLGYGSQGAEALSIATGSSYAPNGIGLIAENLEIAGPLGVSGSYPVLGAVTFGGNLQTGGQGQVAYSTGSGVGLSAGGCGYGQSSAQPTVASGLSGCSYGLSGLFGSSCGCGNRLY